MGARATREWSPIRFAVERVKAARCWFNLNLTSGGLSLGKHLSPLCMPDKQPFRAYVGGARDEQDGAGCRVPLWTRVSSPMPSCRTISVAAAPEKCSEAGSKNAPLPFPRMWLPWPRPQGCGTLSDFPDISNGVRRGGTRFLGFKCEAKASTAGLTWVAGLEAETPPGRTGRRRSRFGCRKGQAAHAFQGFLAFVVFVAGFPVGAVALPLATA